MRYLKYVPYTLRFTLTAFLLIFVVNACTRSHRNNDGSAPVPENPIAGRAIAHLDHSAFFKNKSASPQSVTKACLKCHKNSAKEVMQTAHWTWISGDAVRNGKDILLGKRNQVNNFCISVVGNWASCTICH
ncbi:MAG: hypothetical protein WCI48_15760, partial [Bacteroidota bacterium]